MHSVQGVVLKDWAMKIYRKDLDMREGVCIFAS